MPNFLNGKAIIAASAILTAAALPAAACSCPPELSAASQAEKWDLVATVQVIDAERIEPKQSFWSKIQVWRAPPPPQPARLKTAMKIEQLLKGGDGISPGDVITLHSSEPGMPACGISYRKDQEITLLASQNDAGNYYSYGCGWAQFPEEDFVAALAE